MSKVILQVMFEQVFVVTALMVKDLDDLNDGVKYYILGSCVFGSSENLEEFIQNLVMEVNQLLRFDMFQLVKNLLVVLENQVLLIQTHQTVDELVVGELIRYDVYGYPQVAVLAKVKVGKVRVLFEIFELVNIHVS